MNILNDRKIVVKINFKFLDLKTQTKEVLDQKQNRMNFKTYEIKTEKNL